MKLVSNLLKKNRMASPGSGLVFGVQPKGESARAAKPNWTEVVSGACCPLRSPLGRPLPSGGHGELTEAKKVSMPAATSDRRSGEGPRTPTP